MKSCTHLFVEAESMQPSNVQSEYGWIQWTELVDVYDTVYKVWLGIC